MVSHSEMTKRGYSLYIEKWNPSAKKYINVCAICGKKGYSPVIETDCFCSTAGKIVIYKELTKTLSRLSLDKLGRCVDCAKIQDRNS